MIDLFRLCRPCPSSVFGKAVNNGVLASCHNAKVADAVIKRVSVFMMKKLTLSEPAVCFLPNHNSTKLPCVWHAYFHPSAFRLVAIQSFANNYASYWHNPIGATALFEFRFGGKMQTLYAFVPRHITLAIKSLVALFAPRISITRLGAILSPAGIEGFASKGLSAYFTKMNSHNHLAFLDIIPRPVLLSIVGTGTIRRSFPE